MGKEKQGGSEAQCEYSMAEEAEVFPDGTETSSDRFGMGGLRFAVPAAAAPTVYT